MKLTKPPVKRERRGYYEIAKTLEIGERYFCPFKQPRQLSPYCADWNKRHTEKYRTVAEIVRGVWGSSFERIK